MTFSLARLPILVARPRSAVVVQLTGTVPAFLAAIKTMTELEVESNKVRQAHNFPLLE